MSEGRSFLGLCTLTIFLRRRCRPSRLAVKLPTDSSDSLESTTSAISPWSRRSCHCSSVLRTGFV